jgi:MoxR-like ATPase
VEADILARYGGVSLQMHELLGGVGVLERSLLGAARAEVEHIHIAPALMAYVLDLAQASRQHSRLALGLSTRGALALLKAARTAAALQGRDFVSPDDVKETAVWVLPHRLLLTPEAALEGTTDVGIVQSLLAETPVPR